MDITIVMQGSTPKQVFIGKPTEQLKKWVRELNDNPLLTDDEFSLLEKYSDTNIWDLLTALGIDINNNSW